MSSCVPGPWRASQAGTTITATLTFEHKGEKRSYESIIARTPTFVNQMQRVATARLMAAAPDLLEALRGVLRVADRKTDEFDAARAAIAKATGEAA